MWRWYSLLNFFCHFISEWSPVALQLVAARQHFYYNREISFSAIVSACSRRFRYSSRYRSRQTLLTVADTKRCAEHILKLIAEVVIGGLKGIALLLYSAADISGSIAAEMI